MQTESRKQKILTLQKDPKNIYNICMIAHVDHGKTSLTDALLSLNNLVSKKMIGKILHLDFREDEQERQITMKSSAITLVGPQNKYLLNIIDSPGHIDFGFEVVCGLKLADGAILIVDAVEGVSSQTRSLMRKAVENNLKIVLFLNKIDRLIEIMNLGSEEMFFHLRGIVESVNANMNILMESKIKLELEKNKNFKEEHLRKVFIVDDHFSPLKDNVVFGSVIDGWAFRTKDLAKMYAKKWGMNEKKLAPLFWGDYYLNLKTKKISKNPIGNLKPIFVQFILELIYKVYNSIKNEDLVQIQKLTKSFKMKITAKDLKKSKKKVLFDIMQKWFPIHTNVFNTIIEQLPNALQGQQNKILKISENWAGHENIKNSIMSCKPNSPPIAIISKYFPMKIKGDLKFLGFGRLLAGTLKKKDKIFITNSKKEKSEVIIDELFFWMGQKPVEIEIVNCGNIFGFYSNELKSLKTAFIGPEDCPNLLPVLHEQSFIKVRIRAKDLDKMTAFVTALKILNRVDPVCEVYNDDKGDFILLVNGEIHLERCIRDLEKNYFGFKVVISEILVDFKETIECTNFIVHKKFKKEESESRNLEEENDYEQEMEDNDNKIKEEEEKEKIIEELKIEEEKKIEEDKIKQDEKIKEEEEKRLGKKKPHKLISRFDEDDFDYDYLKDENKDNKNEEIIESSESSEEENTKDYTDIRFDLKETDFVWKNIKEQTKDITKKKKNIKIQKYKLADVVKDKKNYTIVSTPDKKMKMTIQCVKIPQKLIDFLIEHEEFMKEVFNLEKKKNLSFFFDKIINILESEKANKSFITLIKKHLDCFGPRLYGNNLLINCLLDPQDNIFNRNDFVIKFTDNEKMIYKNLKKQLDIKTFRLDDQFQLFSELKTGFHQAVLNGPMCAENLYGCAFIIENIEMINLEKNKKKEKSSKNFEKEESNTKESPKKLSSSIKIINSETDSKKDLSDSETLEDDLLIYLEENSAHIIRTVIQGSHLSFLGATPRLVQGYYEVSAYCTPDNKDNVCETIKKKNGKILDIEFKYEFNMILIIGYLPVHESYGFYKEILKNTSGRVEPQLKFGGWDVIDQDPFFGENFTEGDLEDHGMDFKIRNYAQELLRGIRKRKGLVSDEKIVEDGDKQCTLTK